MPRDDHRVASSIEANPGRSMVRYHKRYALAQIAVFLVVTGVFLALIIRQNLHNEILATAQHSQLFLRQALLVEQGFLDLQKKILELKMAAEEDLFQSRENAAPRHDLFRFLRTTPDGQAFHLDEVAAPYRKERIGNLTGDGSLEGRSPEDLRDLSMALSLSDDFDRTAKTIPDLTWIYYYSKSNFALYYPWCPSQETRFEREAFKTTAWTLGLPEHNPKREAYWTETYFDAVGKGLMVSCLASVYDKDEFRGVVGGDLSVDYLNEIIQRFEPRPGSAWVIYDQLDQILAAPGLIAATDQKITPLGKVLPPALVSVRDQLAKMPQGMVHAVQGWYVTKERLHHTPFTLLAFEPMPTRAEVLFGKMGYGTLILLGGLIALLSFFLIVSHWSFIHPSEKLVLHLLDRSKRGGVNPIPKVPQAWRPWFQMITQVFDDKETLTDHLQKVNRELSERNRFIESIINLSPDLLYIYDLVEKKNVFCSHSIQTVLGYSPEALAEMGDQLIARLMHPDDLSVYLEETAAKYARTQDNARISHEYRMKHQDGHWRWLESTELIYQRNADGSPQQILGTIRDITGRKQAEAEREKLETQLHQAQKLESIGLLAGGVAHDSNNMLSIILGNTELALMTIGLDHPIRNHLVEVMAAGQRSANLTRQLLTFARKQLIAPQVLNFNDTIASMLTMLQRLIGEDLELSWSPAPNLWPVKIDPTQLDQLLANLLLNARDAIAGVGQIAIKTEEVTIDDADSISHADCLPGQYVMLGVSDNGHGMTPEVMAQIFDPFFTTKEIGKGTGLGLATVFGIVKQNGGFIQVDSEPGKGTTFRLYLPRHAEVETMAAGAPVAVKPPLGTETVLLVEDEPALLDLGKRLLTELGYIVTTAINPAEALSLAEKDQGPIHLLMTDVMMPGMNGRELFTQLKTRRPELKCLFMSGYTADIIDHQGHLDGDFHFLQKPFSMANLAVKLRQALDAQTSTTQS